MRILSTFLAIAVVSGSMLWIHPGVSQGQSGIIINNADAVLSPALTVSPDLATTAASITSHVIHSFGASSQHFELAQVPTTMYDLLTQVSSTVVFAFGSGSFHRDLQATPTNLESLLTVVEPRTVFSHAGASVAQSLYFPDDLVSDRMSPQVVAVDQLEVSGRLYLRWTTNEFTIDTIRYGTAPGQYSSTVAETLYAKIHLLDVSALSPGTYYFQVSSIDVSGNSATSQEWEFAISQTPRNLYLPMIRS